MQLSVLSLNLNELHLDLGGLRLDYTVRGVDSQVVFILVNDKLAPIEALMVCARRAHPALFVHFERVILREHILGLGRPQTDIPRECALRVRLGKSLSRVSCHVRQDELVRYVENCTSTFFEAEHTLIVFAPAEYLTLPSYSKALFVSCKDLSDFV